jgi:hypothetical protein
MTCSSPRSALRSAVHIGDCDVRGRAQQRLNQQLATAQHRRLKCTARESFLVEKARDWSFGLAHKAGCVALKLLNVRLHAEPRGSRLVVDQGTRDSRAATARRPASRRRKFPREGFVPRFLDHEAGRMWSFDLDAGSSPAIVFACATDSLRSATVVTTRPGVGDGRVVADGRIPSQTMPSTLEVALKGLGRGSS